MRVFNIFFILTLALFSKNSYGVSLSEVLIEGNQRIEKASIVEKIALKKGSVFKKSKVTADVKNLFETGFFYNIKADLNGTVLIYKVVEKPMISEVVYEGNRAFDDDDLAETSLLKVNQLLDIKKVNYAILEIKKKYDEKGFYLAKFSHSTKTLKNGDQKLTISIKEGDKVKVRKVNLIGNRVLTDKKLKSVMATREVGIFGTSGNFQRETLKRDKEVLAFIYQNEGYAQVKVSEPDLSLTRDKRGLVVTYHIEEGKKYKVGETLFSGDVDFTKEELNKSIKIDEAKYFSRSVLMSDILSLQAKYGDEGYAYANVVPRPKMSPTSDVVDLDFLIRKGEKISIGEINVKGNTNTRDKVVRRELRLYEGELYNETNKRKSLANVKRLGFFNNVEFQTKVSRDGPEFIDLDVSVEERSTGQLNLGAGYGGFQGFTLQGSVQQANFLGKGINFGLNINYSAKRQQLFNINLTDPYFLDSDWSVGLDAYRSLSRVLDFQDTKTGMGLTFGRRFGDYMRASLKYTFEKVDTELNADAFTDVFTPKGTEEASGYSSGVTLSFSYDRRNDRRFPTKGYYGRLSLQQTGLGGDLTYTKIAGNARFYQPIIGSLVLRNSLNYGWVTAPGEVPFNELYRLGGPNTIRGYNFFSIAEKVNSAQAFNAALVETGSLSRARKLRFVPFGGVQQFYYNLEFEWALVKEAGIKGVVFFDTGTANDKFSISKIKSAWGLGVRWNSPMGPLRFEWGFPIDPDLELGEEKSNFQFSIMQSF